MSLDAGLSEGTVQRIVEGPFGARPETLKALADRWGTDEDYRELLRLAGHPLPKPAKGEREALPPRLQHLLDGYEKLPPEERAAIDWLLDPEAKWSERQPVLTTINAMRKLGIAGQLRVAADVVSQAASVARGKFLNGEKDGDEQSG